MSKKALLAEVEADLIARWKAGDEEAGNQIVEAFRLWCMTIARNYSAGRDDEELKAAALEGLANAMRLFDPSRGVRLSTFAALLVNQAIQKQITARVKARDHLSFCGTSAAAEAIGEAGLDDPFPEIHRNESVQRLMDMLLAHEDLPPKSKAVIKLFLEQPYASLNDVGAILKISREGVRHHLLRVRKLVREDDKLRSAAREAGVTL